LGNYVFAGLGRLTNFTVDADNSYFTSIDGVLFNKAKTTLIQYPDGRTDILYTVPDGVTAIGGGGLGNRYLQEVIFPNGLLVLGGWAFNGSGLRQLTLPESLTTIGECAFQSCRNLRTLTIPQNVTSIEHAAFNSSGLTSVTILSLVTSIGKSAFYNCTALKDFTVYWNTPLSIDSTVFENVNLSAATLHVPSGTKAAYETADVWKDFGTIVEDVSTATVSVTGVSLNASTQSLTVGQTVQLTASVSPTNATNKNVTWSSSNTSVAEVNASGLVTAKAAGTATITATTADSGKTASCAVTVTRSPDASSLRFSSATLDFTVAGETKTVSVTSNVSWTVEPYYASWLTVSPLSGSNNGTVILTAAANTGAARITPVVVEGGGITDTVYVMQTANPTGILTPDQEVKVFSYNGVLTVNSPSAERIDIYSFNGMYLYSALKPEGGATFIINSLHEKTLIVRGSSGWVRKIMK
jgi:uncharacterized protein YjdB